MKIKIWLVSSFLFFYGLAQANEALPLKVLVGFGAGGSADLAARLIAERLKDELGRPVVVENRVGAGGRIAAEALKNAAPNGATVMLAPIVVPVLAPLVFKKLNYDVQKDLAPVAHIANFQFGVSVKADSPIRNISDLLPVIKKTPTLGTFGSPASGSLPHFFGVMISQSTGLNMTHVPYNGGAQLMTGLLGDQVTLSIDTLVDQGEMHRAGKSRILATSGAQRNALFPDVPTLRESGFKDLVGVGWFGLFAPGGTDSAQIATLSAAVNRALNNPTLKDRFTKMGLEIGGGNPQDLQALISSETARWAPVVKASGFTAD
ncbi:MAG: ABC transporter substrate-binding protein [Betaproteobacteria bacterium]|nr:ABC transporter substrate-binding protein [Betaproteobacteria bacterium]